MFKIMSNQSVKFIFVGIFNTVIGYLVYYFCLKVLNFDYIKSLSISYLFGVIHSFFWNTYWTFQKVNRINILIRFLKFSSVYVISFLINLALLSLLVQFVGINSLVAQVISLIITTVITYIGHKHWSFK